MVPTLGGTIDHAQKTALPIVCLFLYVEVETLCRPEHTKTKGQSGYIGVVVGVLGWRRVDKRTPLLWLMKRSVALRVGFISRAIVFACRVDWWQHPQVTCGFAGLKGWWLGFVDGLYTIF